MRILHTFNLRDSSKLIKIHQILQSYLKSYISFFCCLLLPLTKHTSLLDIIHVSIRNLETDFNKFMKY